MQAACTAATALLGTCGVRAVLGHGVLLRAGLPPSITHCARPVRKRARLFHHCAVPAQARDAAVFEERQSQQVGSLRTDSAQLTRLLDQVREAHIDPHSAVSAYIQLRRDRHSVLQSLSDIKLERLCEAIVRVQSSKAAGMIVDDIARDSHRQSAVAHPSAMQILLGKGFLPDGGHILDAAHLKVAVRIAKEGIGRTEHVDSNDTDNQILRHASRQDVIRFLMARRDKAQTANIPKSFILLLLRNIDPSLNPTQIPEDPEEFPAISAALLAYNLYLIDASTEVDPAVCSRLSALIQQRQSPGSTSTAQVSSRSMFSRWRMQLSDDPVFRPYASYVELSTLCMLTFLDQGRTRMAVRIIQTLQHRLRHLQPTSASHGTPTDEQDLRIAIPAKMLEWALKHTASDLVGDAQKAGRARLRLIQTFEATEQKLLPYVPSPVIMSLTGRVAAATVAQSGNGLTTSGPQKVAVGELLELALRSRQSARLTRSLSHDALIKVILRSPVFPAIFVQLSKLRRGDLVGSLLELLKIVPPLPKEINRKGPFAALSDSQATRWTGATEQVLPADRLVILQAAAQSKLRWHAAFLYHRWAEDQLLNDNAPIFERVGVVIGGNTSLLTRTEEGAVTSRIALPLIVAQQALQRGVALKSNPIIDSATCTLRMVQLFATSDPKSLPAAPIGPVPSRQDVTEAEYARVIFNIAIQLAGDPKSMRSEDVTSYAAAAFALQDTQKALQLLSSKVESGQTPDITDVGVMLAGIANGDVDLAVNMFLDKLNNVEAASTEGSSSQILARLEPTPALYSMLISKSMFKARSDLVARLLADADQRGLMSTTILRSLDVILRQHIDVRPIKLLELLDQLTRAEEWTPDTRILAWFARCASRGHSLQEAMERAEAHALRSHTDAEAADDLDDVETPSSTPVGSLDDIRAAVGLLSLSSVKLGYVHGPTASTLVKQLSNSASRQGYQERQEYIRLLDRLVQVVFHARRVDLGAQQRSLEGTVWSSRGSPQGSRAKSDGAPITNRATSNNRSQSALLPHRFGGFSLRAYLQLHDFDGARQVAQWYGVKRLPLPRLPPSVIEHMDENARKQYEQLVREARGRSSSEGRTKAFWRRPAKHGDWWDIAGAERGGRPAPAGADQRRD